MPESPEMLGNLENMSHGRFDDWEILLRLVVSWQQVSRSLQFYLASGSGREQPEKILICGGCGNVPGVADVIQSRVGITAEKGDPLGQMKLSSRARAQAVQRDATALLTACGLALRSFD